MRQTNILLTLILFLSLFAPPSLYLGTIVVLVSTLILSFIDSNVRFFVVCLVPYCVWSCLACYWSSNHLNDSYRIYLSLLRAPLTVCLISGLYQSNKIDLMRLANNTYIILTFFVSCYACLYLYYIYSPGTAMSFMEIFHTSTSHAGQVNVFRLTMAGERFISIFHHPSICGTFFSLSSILYINRQRSLTNTLLITTCFYFAIISGSRTIYFIFAFATLVFFRKELNKFILGIGSFISFMIILFLLILWTLQTFQVTDLLIFDSSFVSSWTGQRLGNVESRVYKGWEVIFSDTRITLTGVNAKELPTLGDGGHFMLFWTSGLIGLVLYSLPLLLATICTARQEIFWISALLFFFFPFTMNEQLIIMPYLTLFLIYNLPQNNLRV